MAPLMSNLQKQGLDSMLRAALAQMQGTTLGSAYPGATSSGYDPKVWGMTAKAPGYSNPFASRPSSQPGNSGPGGGNTRSDPEETGNTDKKRTKEPGGGGGRGGRGGTKAATLGATSPWANILAGLQAPTQGAAYQGMQGQPLQFSNLATSQFARPYNYAMTGNYPKA